MGARGQAPETSDNGNWILDCRLDPIGDPARLTLAVRAIPGVVPTGLFLLAVLVENEGQVEIRVRPGTAAR